MIHTGFPLLFLPWTMRVHGSSAPFLILRHSLHARTRVFSPRIHYILRLDKFKRRKKIKNNVLTSRLPSFPPVFVVIFKPPLHLFTVIHHKFKRREKEFFFFF
ncbi:hypothetical protein JB92DRAFT_1704909 [Gautieria morchelliformis]|nr:hypothetical protein JB92DRAFT_1704909 [Gautieria morchelliformis]